MEVTRNQTCEQYQMKAEQIAGLRAELNQYAQALHRPLPCGRTLFELVNQYEEYRSAPDLKPFGEEILEKADAAFLSKQLTMTERLIAAAKSVGHPSGHPLEPVRCKAYSQRLRTALPEAVSGYHQNLEQLEQAAAALSSLFGLAAPETLEELQHLAELADAFLPWTELPAPWARAENLSRYLCDVQEMAEHFQKARALRSQLEQQWNPGFFDLDGQALMAELNDISSKWFLPKLLGMNTLVKRMASYTDRPVTKDQLQPAFSSLIAYQSELKKANELFQVYGDALDALYSGASTDWNAVTAAARQAKESAAGLEALTGSHQLRIQCGGQKQYKAPAVRMTERYAAAMEAKVRLEQLLDLAACSDAAHWISGQKAVCHAISGHLDELKEWIT